jgi:5-methylthioadenosine/S-adenosylhomocysteine deaminase
MVVNRHKFVRLIFAAAFFLQTAAADAASWALGGTLLTPDEVMPNGSITVSGALISDLGEHAPPPNITVVDDVGIILPGFIDLHDHLTWNVLPRWHPSQTFGNRYQWQTTADYDRLLRIPEDRLISNGFGCKANVYANVKALAGGASSVTGSYVGRTTTTGQMCDPGLTRDLDRPSASQADLSGAPCPGEPPPAQATVANEVFPMEIPHERVEWYRCRLSNGRLRALLVHLSEGNPADASARREFSMLKARGLLTPGVVIVHGTALGQDQFRSMVRKNVGLVWSPMSNDELYGATTDIATAMKLGVEVAIGPDWSPTGNAGMLQTLNYIATRYKDITPKELVMMATSIPAKLARLDDRIGRLAPGLAADILVIKKNGDAPYETVVSATPADVQLVAVGGVPIYGEPAIMRVLLPSAPLNELTVCGTQKAIAVAASLSSGWKELTAELDAELRRYGSSLSTIECH